MAQITFTQAQDGTWEYTFTSAGPVAVQMNTASAGYIYVYASNDGMVRSLVGELPNPYTSVMFGIDLPAGMAVTIQTIKEVTKAVMADVEG